MIEVAPHLFVGPLADRIAAPDAALINCAHTYHYELHGWKLRDGVDHTKDKCYVECRGHSKLLSLNWIDGEAKYFDYQGHGVAVWQRAMNFITKWIPKGDVLIVCNKGQSRAPSLAMAYLANYTTLLGEEIPMSYQDARDNFTKRYPSYLPGKGITEFLITNWARL